jgi:acetyl-CoA C-acetyltransferase
MASIIGWAHTKFGRLEGVTLESLIARVAADAIADAGIRPKEIDAIYVGNFGGFEKQGFPAAFALDAHADLRFRPATRVENACATGSAAVHAAAHVIGAHQARFVLVVGAATFCSTPPIAPRRAIRRAASPAFSGGSPNSIFSAMATSRKPWR